MIAFAKHIGSGPAALAALIWLVATPADAHGFRVGFIAPASGPQAGTGASARNGFMLATRERDGHADEESDGHLGGLDVYLSIVDSGEGRDSVLARIRELVEDRAVEFLTGVVPAELAAGIRRLTRGGPPYFVDTEDLSGANVSTMDGAPFAAAFVAMYGRAPDRAAFKGYGAARLIDRAVRTVAGDFSRRQAVLRALGAARPSGGGLKTR